MNFSEIFFGAGLILLIIACIGISIIGIRNSTWFGKHKNYLSDLDQVDMKIAKYSTILLFFSIIFFIVGFGIDGM